MLHTRVYLRKETRPQCATKSAREITQDIEVGKRYDCLTIRTVSRDVLYVYTISIHSHCNLLRTGIGMWNIAGFIGDIASIRSTSDFNAYSFHAIPRGGTDPCYKLRYDYEAAAPWRNTHSGWIREQVYNPFQQRPANFRLNLKQSLLCC